LSKEKIFFWPEVPYFGETFIELFLTHNICRDYIVGVAHHLLGIAEILILHTFIVGMLQDWTEFLRHLLNRVHNLLKFGVQIRVLSLLYINTDVA